MPHMTLLRSLLFNLVFFGWSALLALLYLPLVAFPDRAMMGGARLWARSSLWLLVRITGIDHRVHGLENLPSGPAIIASKHQSAWETLAFLLYLPYPVYIVKQELLAIPLFGPYLRKAGMIAIDRKGGASALRSMLDEARHSLELGRTIVIFPEGRRTAPGERRPYPPGVAALYTRLGVPVVPVALNSGLFWGRRSFLKSPGVITLEFLPAIKPGLKRAQFTDELTQRIEDASQRLIGETDKGKNEPRQACEPSTEGAAGNPVKPGSGIK
jgi:1-acyl-sn-glycerol-3-phosphate acyltransferase